MSAWRTVIRGLRVLFRRTAADRELEEELQSIVDATVESRIAGGMTPEAARRAARLDSASDLLVREQVRASGWEAIVMTTTADVRHAIRRLRAAPTFTLVAIVTLALGIGATTAIFSAAYPILVEPLPYPHSERIMRLWYGADGGRTLNAFGNFREFAARSRVFESMAVVKPWQATLLGPAEPERLDGERVSAQYFQVLGVTPALGRGFDPVDDRVGGPDVVVLANALWRRRFAADRTIVGRAITLDDRLFTVVGVLPADFEDVLAPASEVWALMQYDATLPVDGREWGHHLHLIGRVRPGITVDAARADLAEIARLPVAAFPRTRWASMDRGVIVSSLRDDVTRAIRPALMAISGAVGLLLAIACVNVTSLLLARGARQRGELMMRAALGAGRSRLVRHSLTESLLLSLSGGLAGFALARASFTAITAVSPPELPRLAAIAVNGWAFAFAVTISTVVGVVVGVLPALEAGRAELQVGTRGSSRTTVRGHQLTRRVLVATEVALALVLLVSAGLLLRSLERLFAIAPGFNPSHVLSMQVQVSSAQRYPQHASQRFFDAALESVRRVPGVSAAAFTVQLPLSGDDPAMETYAAQIEREDDRLDRFAVLRYTVSPGYFEAMGIPLRRGRLFDGRDHADGTRPIIVSESLARLAFSSGDPIGQRIRFAGATNRPWDVIVGVVGDVKQSSLAASDTSAVYATTAQWLWADTSQWLVVRAHGDAAALSAAIKRAVWAVDKDQPIVRVATLDDRVVATEAQRRFALRLFEAFAFVAAMLAAVGIYGVAAGSVAERSREIGVRTAFGASRADIMRLVLRDGLSATAIGAAVGLMAAAAASRALATLLFGISPLDPGTYAAVAALLGVVSVVACATPAWRATRIDPAITLRMD